MSESPAASGDDANVMDKSILIQEMDPGLDEIPAKRMKNDDDVPVPAIAEKIDETEDDEAVLEGDEEDYLEEEELDQSGEPIIKNYAFIRNFDFS